MAYQQPVAFIPYYSTAIYSSCVRLYLFHFRLPVFHIPFVTLLLTLPVSTKEITPTSPLHRKSEPGQFCCYIVYSSVFHSVLVILLVD